ncbi:MAG TPA: hypothetical protein VD996_12010 [Chitinophagaceae bacterium]|nr:hypothetical protein [Chitinophagaceae bacterium]
MNNPTSFYTNRIQELNGLIRQKKQQHNRTSWLRLLVAIAGITATWMFWGIDWTYVTVTVLISCAIFLKLVSVSTRIKQQLNNLQNLLSINQQETQILNGYYTHRYDGSNLETPHHVYAQDLDIFGKASLFQYIHRTTSEQGHQLLATWLIDPANAPTITARQQAAIELSKEPLWRQQLQAVGTNDPLTISIQTSLSRWLSQPHTFIQYKIWQVLRYLLPAISLTCLTLHIAGIMPASTFYMLVIVFLALSSYFSKRITPQYAQLSKHISQLETLAQSLEWIEKGNFQHAPRLQSADGSGKVKALKRILDRMDYRLNPLVFIPLNILLYWDLQQVLQLEQWKAQQQSRIKEWFEVVAETEALSSFANLAFNNPSWAFPLIQPAWFHLRCENAGHPLIPAHKRINNTFSMSGHPQLAFITGSNMAGKSTFLRTIGTNLVLAMAGAPVCATKFETPVLQVMTSMRIADNLEESASTFYAELQKLKRIIEAVKDPSLKHKVFLLLDEILRGTNSLDRHTGSEALIRQLIKEDAVGVIASHDLSLATLEQEYPGVIHNYHFDVTIEGSELSFDYTLKNGVCQTLNATLLMKNIGIEI